MNIEKLKDVHRGHDIFVLGSGKSIEFLPRFVFYRNITIGVNAGWSNHFESVDYMVTKYHSVAASWVDTWRASHVVTTRGERGHHMDWLTDRDDMFIADHNDNPVERFTAAHWPKDENALVVSHSTITTSMHLAAYMGAARIFVVGADCGVIDGRMTVDGHDRKDTTLDILRSFDQQNAIVKDELERRYDTTVMSISPFVTPNMTGHTFESYAGKIDSR